MTVMTGSYAVPEQVSFQKTVPEYEHTGSSSVVRVGAPYVPSHTLGMSVRQDIDDGQYLRKNKVYPRYVVPRTT
jgi:hypothetical protein